MAVNRRKFVVSRWALLASSRFSVQEKAESFALLKVEPFDLVR
jgi:hypothetical protein